MDKIWNYHAWPKPAYQHMPLYKIIKQTTYTLTRHSYPQKFIQYLMTICQQKNVPMQVFQLTLSIASRYLIKNNKYAQPTQLVLLVSLYLAGKVIGNTNGSHGGFTVNQLHNLSNHCFTNKDFYRLQKRILQQLNFNLLQQGICDRQIKAILTMIKIIINQQSYQILSKICKDLQLIVWLHLFTKADSDRLLKKAQKSQCRLENLLTASIIQASLVLSTQCAGRFPATVWMIHVLQIKQDQLSLWVEDILKIALGKQKFQQLKI